jgi:ubiquinone/menaquinone biosynthesis C-methylase UbiE
MSTVTSAHPPGYWLGTGPSEIEHLVAQAEVYAAEAEELLDRIGLPAGAAAIDVGCGVQGILHVLRERVGSAGRVVGLDLEARMLALAAERVPGIETVQADATATGLEPGSFDLVHERTLLLNVTDPQAAVAEMVRLARPGGVVALQEPDASVWLCSPPHPAFEALRAALVATFARVGKDFTIGQRAHRLLQEAGLRDVHVRPTARATRPGDYYQTFILSLCRLLREPVVATGTLTAGELDRGVAEVQEHLLRPDTITCQPLLWQAWGTKPS